MFKRKLHCLSLSKEKQEFFFSLSLLRSFTNENEETMREEMSMVNNRFSIGQSPTNLFLREEETKQRKVKLTLSNEAGNELDGHALSFLR